MKGDIFTDEDDIEEIIDDEEEDELNIFGEEEDTDSLEDIELISMGLIPELFKGFQERYPKKNIFYPPTKIFAKNLTKFAFKWYLARINNEQVKEIKIDKLPEDFDELVVKLIKRGIIEPAPPPKEGTVALYIEKNAELIKEKDKLFKKIQIVQETRDQYEEYLKFLYIMNGKMLRMLLENKILFPVTPEEIEIATEIKEVIE